jgi:hypothetical protein
LTTVFRLPLLPLLPYSQNVSPTESFKLLLWSFHSPKQQLEEVSSFEVFVGPCLGKNERQDVREETHRPATNALPDRRDDSQEMFGRGDALWF